MVYVTVDILPEALFHFVLMFPDQAVLDDESPSAYEFLPPERQTEPGEEAVLAGAVKLHDEEYLVIVVFIDDGE